jgi:ribosome-associated heat shock protein Hsp15
MRLDLYLKRCCLVKHRSEAKRACDNGIVTVDGVLAKPGREVHPGQRVAIAFLDRFLEVEILGLPGGSVSKVQAQAYRRVVRDEAREVVEL